MPDMIDIHPADEQEREQAFRNVHDVWSRGLSEEEHLARRLKSPQHQWARWYVGTLGERVVTSLGCYPIEIGIHGQVVPAIAIGSVHTLAEFRGRAFAPQLIRWVEEHHRGRGAAVSLLYSDIPPAYYRRMGYQECPSYEGWHSPTAPPAAVEAMPAPALRRFEISTDRQTIAELYQQCHSRFAVWVARNAAYWDSLLRRGPADEFFRLDAEDGTMAGYVCLRPAAEGTLRILDLAVRDRSTDLLERLIGGVLRIAAERNVTRVGGWLPDIPVTRACFTLRQRPQEITMLKPLRNEVRIDEYAVQAAQHFREMDHV